MNDPPSPARQLGSTPCGLEGSAGAGWAAGITSQAKGLPPASARHPATAAHRIW
jgi:hypothetical protein